MRFPPSARLFFYYAGEVFRMPTSGQFPDPGKVYTRLYYQNAVIEWPAVRRRTTTTSAASAGTGPPSSAV
jgi:hypothetical protein